ncbi:hypothetical protein [Dictyobacter arantiisoli]|uniref:Uncharacterized protein n=1 Tax=Dictyobacter arantiisoli TaxID=2014874 RepID=A0A5A5TK69_9CHLR|nr:hypothetical protein [Dictyobacter arantiisoli]GCF11672.1 hypothetical protein KDI_52360 [Dictyobacter arantiisoli]
MKWCVCFPEEDILIKRPCLRKACIGNKTAAAFLSFLHYQGSISKDFRQSIENSNQQKNEQVELQTLIGIPNKQLLRKHISNANAKIISSNLHSKHFERGYVLINTQCFSQLHSNQEKKEGE